jgi:hypothetical protein
VLWFHIICCYAAISGIFLYFVIILVLFYALFIFSANKIDLVPYRLSWSVNYIDLTPDRTCKRKCQLSLDQASPIGN